MALLLPDKKNTKLPKHCAY